MIVVSYPKLFSETILKCNFVTLIDQIWIDNWIDQLDDAIDQTALSEGVDSLNLYSASAGHEICARTLTPYLNGILAFSVSDSFHPTVYGYRATSELLRPRIRNNFAPVKSWRTTVGALDRELTVPPHGSIRIPVALTGGPGAGFTIQGTGVTTRLISPSGRIIDRHVAARDAAYTGNSVRQHYSVGKPQPGQWVMEISAAYTVSLIVTDDHQGKGFAATPHRIVIKR